METVEVEYIYSLEKKLSPIRKEVFLLRCVISYLTAIILVKIGYILYLSVKIECKVVKQKHLQ